MGVAGAGLQGSLAKEVKGILCKVIEDKRKEAVKFDGLVKSPRIVMPDLIRHPEPIEFTGFRLSPE